MHVIEGGATKSIDVGCLHTIMTLYGCHDGNFSCIIYIQEINKIKFIEIIKKGTHLFKTIIINSPKMKKSNQNCG
jgi:hypothetical protein